MTEKNGVERSTANDILRRLLDERGVEWRYKDERTTYWYGTLDGEEWGEWTATEMGGHLHLTFSANGDVVTPEQAIAATLGSCNCSDNCTNSERTGTCKLDDFADVPFSVDYEIEGYDMDSGRDYAALAECSACGAYIIVPPEYHHVLTCDGDEVYQPYRYCPNCGAKVVDPTTNDVDAEVAQ